MKKSERNYHYQETGKKSAQIIDQIIIKNDQECEKVKCEQQNNRKNKNFIKKQNEQRTKEKDHQRFIRMILDHKSDKKQIMQLQQIKQNTELQIHLRYLKSKQNKWYRFPLTIEIEKKKNQPQTYKLKNNQFWLFPNQKYNQAIQNQVSVKEKSLKKKKQNKIQEKIYEKYVSIEILNQINQTQYPQTQKDKKRQDQYTFFINDRISTPQTEFQYDNKEKYLKEKLKNKQQSSSSDQQLYDLRDQSLYNLREQNNKFSTEKFTLSNLLEEQLRNQKRKNQKLHFFKPLAIVSSSNSKALSLQLKYLNEKKSQGKQTKIIKTIGSQYKNQTLEGLRIARLLQKQKQLMAIRSQPKLKSKNFNISYLHTLTEISDINQALKIVAGPKNQIVKDRIREQNQVKFQIKQNDQFNNQTFYIDQDFKRYNYSPKQKRNDRNQFLNYMIAKSESQKKAKNYQQKIQHLILPQIRQNLDNKKQISKQKKLTKKQNNILISNKKINKKIKTLGNDLDQGIRLIIGKKLKTQVNTPQYKMSPPKVFSAKPSMHEESDLSLIFSNEKFKNLCGIDYVQIEQKDYRKTKKKFNYNESKTLIDNKQKQFQIEKLMNENSKQTILTYQRHLLVSNPQQKSQGKISSIQTLNHEPINRQKSSKRDVSFKKSSNLTNQQKNIILKNSLQEKRKQNSQNSSKIDLNSALKIKGKQKNLINKNSFNDEKLLSRFLLKEKLKC